jgi:hypothetical protein
MWALFVCGVQQDQALPIKPLDGCRQVALVVVPQLPLELRDLQAGITACPVEKDEDLIAHAEVLGAHRLAVDLFDHGYLPRHEVGDDRVCLVG